MIQFVDLNRQYAQIKDEVHAKIDEVIKSKAFVQGKFAKTFEDEYAKLHGLKHVIGCSSGGGCSKDRKDIPQSIGERSVFPCLRVYHFDRVF